MKIALMVHSKTGNTRQLGNLFAEKLRKKHLVEYIDLRTDVPVNSGTARHPPKFEITNLPDGKHYDALLFGGPVWAFSASPVIIAAIKETDMEDKPVLPFVTMGFPLQSMGGSQAISLMSRTAEARGAKVLPGVIVPGLFRDKNRIMEEEVSEAASLFK